MAAPAAEVLSIKRCSFERCSRPDVSSHFYEVQEGCNVGGQDWTNLVGSVLCNACYCRYMCKGTLDKPEPFLKRCSYEGCANPNDSSNFIMVEATCITGQKDWSSLVGKVLCKACYVRYSKRGTLVRSRSKRNKPLATTLKRCTYAGCSKPDMSSKYVLIEEGRRSGNQDWSSVVGNVLCTACYMRYKQRGTLKRCYNKDIPASQRQCAYQACDTAPEEGTNFFQVCAPPAHLAPPHRLGGRF